jgi:type IV fimbrial biogenesis protein FimT
MSDGTIGPYTRRRRQGGFTLVETMTTLAVASVLVSAAVPPMQDFITRNRMSAEVNTFVASLYLARSEAVKRLQNVKVCPANSDYSACSGSTEWQGGWMVFLDVNNDDSVTSGEDMVLQQNAALPSRFNIIGAIGRTDATFQSNGQASGSNNTLEFCDTEGVANTREVILSNEGRVRVNQLTITGCS